MLGNKLICIGRELLSIGDSANAILNKTRGMDFLVPLILRVYLASVFWVAGANKFSGMDGTVEWFGNTEWGLGLPFPEVMAWLVTLTESGGAILLILGLGVRWVSIPMMITMLVAMFSVHWPNGWQAVADAKSAFPPVDVDGAVDRLNVAKSILREHGNYGWLTEKGSFVISNNGIEWAVTYFIMCLTLLFTGAGRWVSMDYWLSKIPRSA